MRNYLCEDLQRQLDVRDRIDKLEKLIEDMAKEYASEHQYCFFHYDIEDIKKAFINGFKACMKFKEELK